MSALSNQPALDLREEFNRWAEAGRGEEMEESHLPIVVPMLGMMEIRPSDRILDLGCGSGWLVRRLASILPEGSATGIDVSDEMVRRAGAAARDLPNVSFLHGTAEDIPAAANSFDKIISVESAYYWHDVNRGLREMLRVLAPGGSAWILINYYEDNLDCHQWTPNFKTPTTLLSADAWKQRFESAGFEHVRHERIPDTSPTLGEYTGRWFRDAEQLRRFKATGALLVTGIKP
jgi:SAM-dependent methyltransferase